MAMFPLKFETHAYTRMIYIAKTLNIILCLNCTTLLNILIANKTVSINAFTVIRNSVMKLEVVNL